MILLIICVGCLRPPAPPTVEHFCRDTQTVEEKLRVQQTTNNMTTQMTKVGVYVATATDRLIAPGDYTTADTRQQHILDQVMWAGFVVQD